MENMNIIKTPRHRKVAVGNVTATLHGIFAEIAMKGKWKLLRLPHLTSSPFETSFEQWLIEVNKVLVESEDCGSWVVLPFKVSATEGKDSFAILVHCESPLGKVVLGLSEEQRSALYANAASVCQYGNQPFEGLMTNVPVRVIDEGVVTCSLDSFRKQLNKKLSDSDVIRFFGNHKESVSVPYGDGQAYCSPDSPIWGLLPETVNGKDVTSVTSMKSIGWLSGMPFVFLKGVLVKLTKEEWSEKCAAAGVDSDYVGIIANTHTIKNKLGLDLGSELNFHIGYHGDSRRFEGKSQIFGNQAYRRSTNLVDRMRYTRAAMSRMDSIYDAVASGDVSALLTSISGVSAVVSESTPFHGNVINLLRRGLPLDYINDFGEVIRNMIVKRVGRPKISQSDRTLPKCSTRFGILQCGLTRTQARKLNVRVGDTIVVIRSPKAAGFPAMTQKVVSTNEPVFTINPVVYALFNQGDFDGDTVAIYRNLGIVECKHSLINTLDVIFEQEDTEWADNLETVYSTAVEGTWSVSSDTIDGLHPICGPLYQMLMAQAATGSYDNFATRSQKAGMGESHLRSFWNHITQKTITGMKHVGDTIADPLQLAMALGDAGVDLADLDDIHHFLSGNRGNYSAAVDQGIVSANPCAQRITAKFEGLDLKGFVERNSQYSNSFKLGIELHFDEVVADVMSRVPHLVTSIFQVKGGVPQKMYGNGVMLLKQPFYHILNPPRNVVRPTYKVRLRNLVDAVDGLASTVSEQLDVWNLLYCISLKESFKRWLLTNIISDEVDLVVGNLVSAVSKKCGFGEADVVEDDTCDE